MFPENEAPAFLAPHYSTLKAICKRAKKTPAPRPVQSVTLPLALRHRGKLSELTPPKAAQPSYYAYFGGNKAVANIVPPPRRRASPSPKKIGGVCSLRSRSGRKPVPQRLKGGGAVHGRSHGQRSRKKRNHPCLHFFLSKSGIHAAPPPYCHSGSLSAHPALRLAIKLIVVRPTARPM